jgi:hypothetical protein
METPNPGQVVSPNNTPSQPPVANPAPPPAPPVKPPQPPAQTPPAPQTEQLPPQQVEPVLSPDAPTEADNAVSWTASEYIEHHKSAGWYLLLFLAAIAVAVGVYFITSGDITSVVVVVLAAIILGTVAARKPREQHYSISDSGITIGPKNYGFEQFKSFSLIEEDAFSSITFMPMKRFMPAISIYYDPNDEARIVDVLSIYLPIEDRGHDAIDRFMKKIRF